MQKKYLMSFPIINSYHLPKMVLKPEKVDPLPPELPSVRDGLTRSCLAFIPFSFLPNQIHIHVLPPCIENGGENLTLITIISQ